LDFSRFHARLPAFPDVPETQHGRGDLFFRYEDVTQDGRLGWRASSHGIGAALWRDVLDRHPLAPTLFAQGIVPILTRIVVAVGGGPIAIRSHVHARGGFELVEAVDAAGKSRFRADMWANIEGTASRTFGPSPENAGERVGLGAMWAEHVLTRPFAPPAERTVAGLPEGMEAARRVAFAPPSAAVGLPEGARWIDDAFVPDAAPLVLGLGHTDSNQHVNSLVYPQVLEDAALRRLHSLGLPIERFVGRMEMAYRKPSFAGDVLTVRVRTFVRSIAGRELHGVAGVFATEAEHAQGLERARAFGTVELEP
jgi:hypothetical protein